MTHCCRLWSNLFNPNVRLQDDPNKHTFECACGHLEKTSDLEKLKLHVAEHRANDQEPKASFPTTKTNSIKTSAEWLVQCCFKASFEPYTQWKLFAKWYFGVFFGAPFLGQHRPALYLSHDVCAVNFPELKPFWKSGQRKRGIFWKIAVTESHLSELPSSVEGRCGVWGSGTAAQTRVHRLLAGWQTGLVPTAAHTAWWSAKVPR